MSEGPESIKKPKPDEEIEVAGTAEEQVARQQAEINIEVRGPAEVQAAEQERQRLEKDLKNTVVEFPQIDKIEMKGGAPDPDTSESEEGNKSNENRPPLAA
jgi:hypothetical protein